MNIADKSSNRALGLAALLALALPGTAALAQDDGQGAPSSPLVQAQQAAQDVPVSVFMAGAPSERPAAAAAGAPAPAPAARNASARAPVTRNASARTASPAAARPAEQAGDPLLQERTASTPAWASAPYVMADDGRSTVLGRYSTSSAQPPQDLIEPIETVVSLSFPRQSVRTIEQAIDFTLMRSGYRFEGSSVCEAGRQFLQLPLPESQRQLGPYSVFAILNILSGSAWQAQVNRVNRTVTLGLRPAYVVALTDAAIARAQARKAQQGPGPAKPVSPSGPAPGKAVAGNGAGGQRALFLADGQVAPDSRGTRGGRP